MRILQTHADYIEFEPVRKEISLADKVEMKKKKIDEVLVLFVTVEKGDDLSCGEQAIKDAHEFLQKQKVEKVLVYPFAHLSRNLAKPKDALDILNRMQAFAKELKIETYRAPFGWNKAMELKVKGHPMAEQSRVYTPGEVADKESKAIEAEEKVKSTWYILEPNGKLTEAKKFKYAGLGHKHENLKKFADYEISKSRNVHQMPAHITLMKKLQIADNEIGSDSGNLKFLPRGRLIKGLLEQWVGNKVADYGGMEVETPVMYDYEHPALKKYLDRFPARQYVVNSAKKDYFLRFSACFGQFLMMAESNISYRDLPMRVYELAKYAFRLENSGELAGLRRLRSFTMPDMHTLCLDMEMSKKEFTKQFELSMDCMNDLELEEYETAIRFTEKLWKEDQEFILNLVKKVNKPVLIEMWNDRFAYFDPKFEFNFVDAMGKAGALSTVQLDHENADRFDIKFIDKSNTIKRPLILHASPSGAIERVMYALLENANIQTQKKKPAKFPVWLSPIQVRLIPLSEKFSKEVEKMSLELEKNDIRVDIDDRDDSVPKKVRTAELEWVPYIVVIGEKEIKSKKIALRDRATGKNSNVKLSDLIKKVNDQTEGKPFRKLNLPKKLSNRPAF